MSLQNAYMAQYNGIYVLSGGYYGAYYLPRGVYDTSEMVYGTMIECYDLPRFLTLQMGYMGQ